MKLRKFLISSAAVVTGASLFATALTSCAKEDIDEDLIIDLDDAGNLVKNQTLDFRSAVAAALTRSKTWATFKQALADEIVFKWYENRAANDDNPDKNEDFQDNLEEMKYQINKDYDSTVDSCKSKYGANWRFYLQNEYLSQYGGTEEAYKHAKLVEKVKDEFIKAVFKTNYFGYTTVETTTPGNYPHIFLNADSKIGRRQLKDPTVWSRIGFYAKTNKSFLPGEEKDLDPNYLARNPDGDYATIQSYVFDRWFESEKPFFSAASLFKYSLPTSTGSKLTDIYNEYRTTVPESPNEAFPFFGGVAITNDDPEPVKGTQGFWEWYRALENGAFETSGIYYDKDGNKQYNGTISIPTAYTDDSQTLLLCTGKDMMTSLYTPYAVAASLLIDQMFLPKEVTIQNVMKQATLATNVDVNSAPSGLDDARILKNFFYKTKNDAAGFTNLFDLNSVYGNVGGQEPSDAVPYHCPLFKENKEYTFLYGDTNPDATDQNGVRYITNNFQVELGRKVAEGYINQQPWMLELNEAGVHAQTIDGWQYVNKFNTRPAKQQALKDVFKYRVFEKLRGFDGGITSCDLFSESGKLQTYFKDNFANIILELAMQTNADSQNGYMNVFRTIESYKVDSNDIDPEKTFLKNINDEQSLTPSTPTDQYNWLVNYVTKTINVDRIKSNIDAIEAANNKIYSYRSEQVKNSKSKVGKQIFNNGLLAPLPVNFVSGLSAYGNTRIYVEALAPIVLNDKYGEANPTGQFQFRTRIDLSRFMQTLNNDSFIRQIESVETDTSSGLSPQIKDAKDVKSNRFWYKSPIIDKLMYSFMGDTTLANAIKMLTYRQYVQKTFEGKQYILSSILSEASHEITSIYMAPKVMSGDTNFSSIDDGSLLSFYDTVRNAWMLQRQYETITNGQYCDFNMDVMLAEAKLAYLVNDNFANFYSVMDSKIKEDETAYIGYLNQYDWYNPVLANPDAPMTKIEGSTVTPFDWTKNAGNIYDQYGYLGGQPSEGDPHVDFPEFWHVIDKDFGVDDVAPKTLGGFLGLITKSSNSLNEASGLKAAAFDHFAKSIWEAPDLTTSAVDYHEDNDGALFPWQGQKYINKDGEAVEYTFPAVVNPEATTQSISSQTFVDSQFKDALKVAYKISTMTTIDDVRSTAKALGDALDGEESEFSKIGEGKVDLHATDPLTEIKYLTLKALLEKDNDGNLIYKRAFQRVVNVELHGEPNEGPIYNFRDGRNCYKLMLTQLNKQDIVEKRLTPTWVGEQTGHWDFSNCVITPDEFWYILGSTVVDSSVQQEVTPAIVKAIYGDEKLIVYDAQLYNQFDTTWIKDWKKKPIGG